MRIRLEHVEYMPAQLEPGVLYISRKYGTAAHLCPCGCGTKVRTPLRPTQWSLEESANGPTLRPSVGNWQYPCQSHYLIEDGQIIWCDAWTADEVLAGRRAEEERRNAYYEERQVKRRNILQRFVEWVKGLFKHR